MAKTPSKKSRAFGKALIAKQAKTISNMRKAAPAKGTAKQTANQVNAAQAKKANAKKGTGNANQARAAKAMLYSADSKIPMSQRTSVHNGPVKTAKRVRDTSKPEPVQEVPGTRQTAKRVKDTSGPAPAKAIPVKGTRVISQKEAQAIALAEAQKKKQTAVKTKKAEDAAKKKAAAVAKKNAKKNPVAGAAPKTTKRKSKGGLRKARAPLGGLKRLRRSGLAKRLKRRTK